MGSPESKMKAVSECLHINSHHVFKHREEQNSRWYTRLHSVFYLHPVQVLQGIELNEDNEPVEKNFMGQLREAESIKAFPKQIMKQAMPFASFVMSKAAQISRSTLGGVGINGMRNGIQ